MKDNRKFKARFQREILKRFRTQAAFVSEIGMAKSRLSDIIRGTVDAGKIDLRRFEQGLGVSRATVKRWLSVE